MEDYNKNEEENINNEVKNSVEGKKEKNIEEEIKTKVNVKEKENKNSKKTIIISICVAIAIVVLLLLCTGFALLNINNTKIISKVSVQGINLSGLSQDEARQILTEKLEQKISKNINLTAENFEYQIQLSQIELNYNINKAVQDAYIVGRKDNIFLNNFDILKAIVKGKEIELEYTFNEELLNNIINDITSKIPEAVVEPNYCIEDDKLIITKGKQGNSINKDKLRDDILQTILLKNANNNINLEVLLTEPEGINIDKIYEEVHTEPKDAYYVEEPFEVFPHVNGIDFDLEAARDLIKEEKEEYEIKLTIMTPEITTDKIGTKAFPNLLSSFTTKYDASNISRTTNLKIAMQKLNGVVVNPGETFSYNKTLGKRTSESGYKEAAGYAGGRVVQTLAGGICQISSTLYDAAVYANLEIVERHNHMFLTSYVGAGKDATVVYGAYDLKFKNTRKYPIMIKTTIGGGVAKIDIYGIKEEIEYEVEIISKILSYTSFKVIYEEDYSLEEGKEKVVQGGMNGCKSITYKVLKLNGVEVSREVLSSDTYDPMNKIVKRGATKIVETVAEPEEQITESANEINPTPTPDPVAEPESTPEPVPDPVPDQVPDPMPDPDQVQENNTIE